MALFNTGAVVATPAALQFCEQHGVNPLGLLGRHLAGDWGDLDAHDVAVSEQNSCAFISMVLPLATLVRPDAQQASF